MDNSIVNSNPIASNSIPDSGITVDSVTSDSTVSFDSFAFSPKLQRTIAEAGFENPTPIQAQAIPVVLSGRDVVGLAQTGTGKTAAFVLPMLQKLITEREAQAANPVKGPRLPKGLILAPTRELAEQINSVIRELGRGTGIRSMVIIGGVSQRPQAEQLREGTDIIVACPGRLIDLVEQKLAKLSSIRFLVLDEADQMFDMGFFPSLRRILGWVPKNRQSLFFSATMPREISGLADEALNDPVRVTVGNTQPVATVAHAIYPVASAKKADLLSAILPQLGVGSILIFTRTKHRAKRLGQQLDRLGYAATSLQGNLSHNRRREAMDGFRTGKYQVMVATDIAARGIDISSVTHVVNFDVPETPEAYTHRIGRTGRALRNGDALTFMCEEDHDLVRAIERKLGKPIERIALEGFDHTLPAYSEGSGDSGDRRRGGRSGGGRNGGGRSAGGRSGGGRPQGNGGGRGRNPNQGRSGGNTGEPRRSSQGAPSNGPRAPRGERGDRRAAF